MKSRKSLAVLVGILSVMAVTLIGCKKDDDKPKMWVVSYSNVSIGDQENYTIGHFFQPKTGESVLVQNTVGIENSLGLMFFTESGASNTFLTFPAHGQTASTFGTTNMRHFTQSPGGVNNWPHADMVGGMIFRASMTAAEFDALKANLSWSEFNNVFVSKNNGNDNLEFKSHYILNPASGNVMLLQFNGLVRAILCVRGVVPSSATGGSLKFDIIIEGKDLYSSNDNAKFIQPAKL